MAHVFISYVHENAGIVGRLCRDLRARGVKVWMDREEIEPGQRWRVAIRKAIEAGDFFLACFSKEYAARDRSYMNDELRLAVDELRMRSGDRTWFIPVKLSECSIPYFVISGGETLQDIQWLDLSADWDAGVRRVSEVIESYSRKASRRGDERPLGTVELQALHDISLATTSIHDLQDLLEMILEQACSLLNAQRGAIYFLEGRNYRVTNAIGTLGRKEFADEELDSENPVGSMSVNPGRWFPGATHLLATLIEVQGRPSGLIMVADREDGSGIAPFRRREQLTLALFANQAAIALESAKLQKLALERERLEREMDLAAEIQQQLLPRVMPRIPGYEVIGWSRPARQVGGDYYDFYGLGEGGWGLVVADVVGKGLPAALIVSTLHSALRVLLDQMEVGPPLMERLNRHIFESTSANKFITMLLAGLDSQGHRLAYLNAGHNPGLLVRTGGEVVQMASAGLPLGLMSQGHFGVTTLELQHGDLGCIYSDGITECEARDEEEFGIERLVQLLSEQRRQPLVEILHRIDHMVTEFAQDLPQGDDQTVILLRRV